MAWTALRRLRTQTSIQTPCSSWRSCSGTSPLSPRLMHVPFVSAVLVPEQCPLYQLCSVCVLLCACVSVFLAVIDSPVDLIRYISLSFPPSFSFFLSHSITFSPDFSFSSSIAFSLSLPTSPSRSLSPSLPLTHLLSLSFHCALNTCRRTPVILMTEAQHFWQMRWATPPASQCWTCIAT